jgi:Tfp pilus assembly PilM family ATPase
MALCWNNYLIDNIQNSFDFFLDIQNNQFSMTYNGQLYEMVIESFDIESGVMLVDNIPFLEPEAQVIRFGNVIYNQGLIVLTREFSNMLTSQWNLDFKSTKTIYEHEYLLIAEQDEFNVSTNPSAIINVGI